MAHWKMSGRVSLRYLSITSRRWFTWIIKLNHGLIKQRGEKMLENVISNLLDLQRFKFHIIYSYTIHFLVNDSYKTGDNVPNQKTVKKLTIWPSSTEMQLLVERQKEVKRRGDVRKRMSIDKMMNYISHCILSSLGTYVGHVSTERLAWNMDLIKVNRDFLFSMYVYLFYIQLFLIRRLFKHSPPSCVNSLHKTPRCRSSFCLSVPSLPLESWEN